MTAALFALAAIIAGIAIFSRYRVRSTPVASEKSIAVLPFDNLSRDPENAYFSEGIQDEILTRLAKIAELKVISRTSTQRFKSSPGDLPQIAQQLGVANILEGSVQKPSDQVRVNVQLIHAPTDTHLWADAYDRKLTDVLRWRARLRRPWPKAAGQADRHGGTRAGIAADGKPGSTPALLEGALLLEATHY